MYVKGVGPARAAMLEAKGLKVVEDLLTYAPFRYEDRSNVKIVARSGARRNGDGAGRSALDQGLGLPPPQSGIVSSHLHRRFARSLAGKWFHGAISPTCWLPARKSRSTAKWSSTPTPGNLAMMHPEYEILAEDEDGDASLHTGRIVPVYEAAGKVTTRALRTLHPSHSRKHRARCGRSAARTHSRAAKIARPLERHP